MVLLHEVTSLLFLFTNLNYVHTYNILGFFATPSLSHQLVFQPIIRELARRGHNLTVVTTNPINDSAIKNLIEIDISKVSYDIWNKYNISSYGTDEAKTDLYVFIIAYIEFTEAQLSHPGVQNLIQNSSNYHFDLFIAEYPHTFSAPFKGIYNTSMIGMSSMPIHMNGYKYIGIPSHPVLYPDINLPYSNKLTFWQKVHSFLYSNVIILFLETYRPAFQKIMSEKFNMGLDKIQDRFLTEYDLVFVNHNPILYVPRPNVPAQIQFYGIHIQPPKELPTKVKTFLDNANEGVIYISFGSNIKSSFLPKARIQLLIDTISEMPYKFLWKFESNYFNMPKNVYTLKWVPQQDVLRHPNIKLFITQGGIQSLEEAMYTTTPVLVIPFFGDQLGNAQKAQEAGLGRALDFASLTMEAFKTSITEVINDKKYKLRLKEVYEILTDQPITALNKTVWWIEYVLRHKGAKHLRCPSADTTFIEYYMIDIIGFLMMVILLVLWFFYVIIRIFTKIVWKVFLSRKIKQN